MLARFHGVDGALGVPRVVRRNHDRVNILLLQQLAVIVKSLHVAGADLLLGMCIARLIKVADRGLNDVVFSNVPFLTFNVGKAHARTIGWPAPNADVADHDPVIGPDNTPGRRRRALTINRCLEWIGCGHHRGGSRRLFQEIPACLPAGQ